MPHLPSSPPKGRGFSKEKDNVQKSFMSGMTCNIGVDKMPYLSE